MTGAVAPRGDMPEDGLFGVGLFGDGGLFDLPLSPRASGPGAPAAATADRVTFLHTADWQLGMTRHFLSDRAQADYEASRLDAVAAIGTLAASTGAEFVVVCGDVFDDPRVDSRIVRRALDVLADFPVPVYLLPGNHDPLDAASIYRSETFTNARPENVRVLDTAGVVRVRDGVSLIAAPWTTKRPDSDLVADQLALVAPGEGVRILVGHGGLDEFTPSSDPAIVKSAGLQAAVDEGLVDYVALGDRHSATSIGSSARIWYAGAPEVTDFDNVEVNSGRVLEVTLSGAAGGERAVDVAEHRVGQWAFTAFRRDVNNADDLAALRADLGALPNKSRTVVRLGLVGALGLADHAEYLALVEEFSERLAALHFWDRYHDLSVIADPSDVAALGLTGYAAEAAAELVDRARSTDAEDAAAARAALSLLFRLAGANA